MKVLFIMHGNNLKSGANLAMLEVIDRLYKEDIDISVLFPQNGECERLFFDERNIKVYYAPYHQLFLSKTESYFKRIIKIPILLYRKNEMNYSCIKLRKLVSQMDLIYSNTCTVYFGAMLSRYYNKPHIWHIREYGDKDHNLIFPFGKTLYYRIAKRIRNHVIAISQTLADDLKKYFSEQSISLVYDDVDPKYDNPKSQVIIEDCINILIAGDIKPGKGQLEVVEAISVLIQRGIENIQLIIAGKIGDKRYYNKICDVIKERKLNHNIEYVGFVSNMNELRKKANIGVVASSNEGFGRVTVEGMLSNMVMIGKNTGATVELIKDGYNGLLYDGSSFDLARKIEMIVHDKKKYVTLSTNGYNYAQKYIKGDCAKKISSIIKKCAGEKNEKC